MLVKVFENISTQQRFGWTADTVTDASGLLSAITAPQFIMAFEVAWKGLAMVKGLSNGLQSTSYDIIKAHRHVQHTKTSVHKSRDEVDEIHSQWFTLAKEKTESVNVDFTVLPRACNQRFWNPNSCPSDYYKIQITIPFLDHLTTQLDERFPIDKPEIV